MAGINPSDIVYKKALEATINSVKRGVEAERAINAGINVIRGTSWFQTKNHSEQREIETSFRESMQKEFGLEVKPKTVDKPKPSVNENIANTRTEVIDRNIIPTAPIKPKTQAPKPAAKPSPKAPSPKPANSFSKGELDHELRKKPAPKPKPIEQVEKRKVQPVVAAKKKKKRGMGLGSFIVSLFFLGFLGWISWMLYHHEISVQNIVVYQNDELVFKEAFPKESISIFGQDIKMPHAISRKTDPIKIYRPKSGFPFFELSQEVPCPSCDYWTNVQNYDLHNYPDKK